MIFVAGGRASQRNNPPSRHLQQLIYILLVCEALLCLSKAISLLSRDSEDIQKVH